MKRTRTDALQKEIAAYETMRSRLEADHPMAWAVVRAEGLIGAYETFESAAHDAMQRFGRGPYLIRQIGAPPIRLPASVRYKPVECADPRPQ